MRARRPDIGDPVRDRARRIGSAVNTIQRAFRSHRLRDEMRLRRDTLPYHPASSSWLGHQRSRLGHERLTRMLRRRGRSYGLRQGFLYGPMDRVTRDENLPRIRQLRSIRYGR